ncbi:16S rRNA (cytidine(1402)-2'-O)-methyltransferase [Kroppenstedtia pulmonis]|uniref:Ribosomal RNA small subunit methyltransferase I n=1 Tax=Kroppenstedtia pulmonis TaxID=1380685 RepID=A0A7D3XGU7_9BACL|nr:16S rRNA (cytidine(1402)-2'-O)-methyltransferase [Kroppenstedtia pulmonis]QKG83064.1 16S rRNA (cytidine(1402)-2'-O)-methyltransferase [Kroppenstedtia pulmonis]
MKRQKSFQNPDGILYVVGTPIGNLGDLSDRARDIFSEVDRIACEDTRHTRKLLHYMGVRVPLVSYHEHNRISRTQELVERMEQGEKIALVSDAGMPALSDPGEELVKEAVARDIPVIPIPGPNAALTAVVASGLSSQPFLFVGFLPRQTKDRIQELRRWKGIPATLLLYEAPHRIIAMLRDLESVLGDRQAAIARELTKKHEEWIRGPLSECIEWFEEHAPRGEMTIVVEGSAQESDEDDPDTGWWQTLTEREHVETYIHHGMSKKEAIRETAKVRNRPKREIYNIYHQDVDK